MIEEIIRNYLISAMDIPVFTEKPEVPPDRYILIEKVGGGMTDYIPNARVALQSYGPSQYVAAEINEMVKRKMDDIIVLDQVSKAERNSDYNYPDITRKKHRYQAIYDLVFFD